MALRLYNTLTRRLEEFAPLAPPLVTLYTCGPTVWNRAHIGNFRTFAFEDVLRRYLEYRGYSVRHVMNITDVDDRTIAAAGTAGLRLAEHTAPFAAGFFEDCRYLRIAPATHYPRATEYVPQMVALVQRLLERGVAYRGDDGSVYFSIERFPGYGRLSRVEQRDLKAGARVSSDEYDKADARDFVLWKAVRPEDEAVGAAWDAPFGRGRPGWHVECSAMAQALLGDTVDIHAGGVDLVFPHHEDEIAQSEAATGKPFVRCWLHAEFLQIGGTKMSKRYGNVVTARDLSEDGWDAAAIRTLFCSTQYRRQLQLTDEALKAAGEGAARLAEFRARLAAARPPEVGGFAADAQETPAGPGLPELAATLEADFRLAMDDDIDMPRALATLMDFVRDANRTLDRTGGAAAGRDAALAAFDRVTGVLQVVPEAVSVRVSGVQAKLSVGQASVSVVPGGLLLGPPAPGESIDAWSQRMGDIRSAARQVKDWARADAARALLVKHGFEVRDARDGSCEVRRMGGAPA